MGADLTHARRALRKQEKAAARLAKRLGKVLDTVDGMMSKLDDVATKGTSRLFKALRGNLWKAVGPILKASLTRLLGVIGAIQTLVDVAAVLRNILNGRIFQEGTGGDPWADTVGDNTDGGPEAPAGPEGEGTTEGDGAGTGETGGGETEGGEVTGPEGEGAEAGEGTEGGTGTEPGTGAEPGTGTGAATGTETGGETGSTGGAPGKDPAAGAESEGKETDGGTGPAGPGSEGKEEAAGGGEGKGDLPDEGGREAPAVVVRPHKLKKGPGEDDEVVEALRDMTVISGIGSKRHKPGKRLSPTLEFNAGGTRFRVKGLPITVTDYIPEDDGYYLEATVSDTYRLGKTKIVVVKGTEVTWDHTFPEK